MSSNVAHLFRTKRFVPLFLVQFFGAFNDNVFKNAFLILATFHYGDAIGLSPEVIAQIVAGLFILPFFLFSAFAGQLADKYEKSRLVRYIKLWEIGAMLLGTTALLIGNVWLLFTTLFFMGAQSAFFGPLKYSLLPFHLRKDELVGGNALFEGATFLSILIGTSFGGFLIATAYGPQWVSGAVLIIAVIGWGASLFVPHAQPEARDLRINPNIFTATGHLLRHATRTKRVFRSILGISWFWLIGAFWLTLVPAYARNQLHADESTVTTLLLIFAFGIGIGSVACNRLLRGEITAKYVPLAALGIALFMGDVAWMTSSFGGRFGTESFGFLSFTGIRLVADLAGIAVCGGLFSVPLYAMMQAWAEPAFRSRVIAANNVMNALFMTAIAILTAVLFAFGLSTATVIGLLALGNVVVAIYVIGLVPESVIHTIVRWLLRWLYNVEVRGEENYRRARERRVIIANHTSFLDAVLLTAFLPERPTFAINTRIARLWWVRPFLWAVKVYPLDPTKPMALKILTDLAREGVPVVIFPEGRLTVTGAIMKVYEGPGVIADKADADLVPIQINGAALTVFSRMRGKVRQRWFPRITITILPPRPFHPPKSLRGRAGRQYMARELYETLAGMYVDTADTDRTLFQGLLDAAAIHGRGFAVLNDIQQRPYSYRRLIAASLFLGSKLCAGTKPGAPVGLLIANSAAGVAAFFGVQAAGRVSAMLNYSAGAASLASACRTAQLRVVWTSRRFVELAKLEAAVAAMREAGIEVRYLESLARRTLADRARLVGCLLFPAAIYQRRQHVVGAALRRDATGPEEPSAMDRGIKPLLPDADRPAVVLFTSGSSGTPKAVVLSHRNLQTNRHQLSARIDLNRNDRLFNCLPIFHAFGLMGGTLLPLLAGVPVFMYPTPLHYGVIPELIYQTNTTILFGTNTFLAGYARRAHPYDFFAVRYVFAGAEKLKENVRRIWAERFGVRIFEGYGATETAPALTMNNAIFNKAGTVGRFLPGIKWKLEAVPGVARGGRLWVRGGNVMLGYCLSEHPGVLQPLQDGWYDTGDVVDVDDEGFVTILGRVKRFAKIGGEMVSLTVVEELAAAVWPEALHAAVTRNHPQKGEEIVLATEHADGRRTELLEAARERGVPELAVPRTILNRSKLPVLGSGKPDYVTLENEVRAADFDEP